MSLPRMELRLAGAVLRAWVARTPDGRAQGLKECSSLAEDEAMLFISDAPAFQSYWMEDTPMALSLAFIADDGAIVEVADLQPGSRQPCRCATPVRYVLEVRQGWFADHGVRAGDRVEGAIFKLQA